MSRRSPTGGDLTREEEDHGTRRPLAGPRGGATLGLVLAALFVVFAAASVALSARKVGGRLAYEGRTYELGMSQRRQIEVLVRENALPIELATFDFYARALRPGERFIFRFSPTDPPSAGFRTVFEGFGRWHLYPNLMVEDGRRADVVLGYGAPGSVGPPSGYAVGGRRGEATVARRGADG